jgi:hypothetical protein
MGRLVALVALALLLAAPAAADPPTPGSGAGTVTLRAITESRTADGNTIQERQNEGVLGGAFDGSFTQDLRGVIHKDGRVTFHGFMVFVGVAGSCGAGTVYIELEGTGIAGAPVTEGRMRTIDQAGSTVPVHVIGTFTQGANVFTYQGTFHCD